MVLYKTTRGVSPSVPFETALLSGYAPDGGLYVPESLPTFTKEQFKSWAKLSFPDLVQTVFPHFVSPDEITAQEIKTLLNGCYSKFDDPNNIIPLKSVGVVKVAEMWHGPTGAFKDIALSVVGRLVDHFLKKSNRKATILVGTSGDTGSAAIHSVLGSEHINIVVWYPRERVSRVQELQMTTVDAPNVRVCSVDGTSDEIDTPIKQLFEEEDFVRKYNLTCFNSINVSRVLLQAIHFMYLYLQVCPEADREVTFCVPSGGMGNVTGGVVAHTMGLPVRFVCGVNENDIVDRAFRLNDFSLADTVLFTPSSAMDIQIPYNIERVFYYLAGQNADTVRDIMQTFEKDGRCTLPQVVTEANSFLETARVDTHELFATMQKVWKEESYAVCPHTAVAMHIALNLVSKASDRDIVVMATATPAKFPEVMKRGGLPVPSVESIDRLYTLAEHKELVERGIDWVGKLKEGVMSF